MSSSPAELVKEKLDIVDVLKGYLTLTPAGKNWKARCPFHNEKTPSFMVSPERQTWHCFGCALGGDLFSFVMRHENIEFGEALKILAEKAGVELKRLNPTEYKFMGLLYDLQTAAKEFFVQQLKQSEPAQAYLKERGLSKETIEEFEIGWAPNASDALTVHFMKGGYNPADLIRAGLVFKTERGMQLDRFRGRIMFPIHNHLGKVVGFTGRILPKLDTGTSGKYVNSPETPIFNKSKLLYGFWKAKNNIRETGNVFLVEGQTDMLLSWQAGVKYAVASSGTALTQDHLRMLRRLTERIVVSFDTDEAGLAAGERAIELAEANDFEVKVATFAPAKDPAEAAQADPQKFLAAVSEAKPAPEFYFAKYLDGVEVKPLERAFLIRLRAVLAKLAGIGSPIVQGHWLKELAKRTGIEEKLLIEEIGKLNMKKSEPAAYEVLPVPDRKDFNRWELLSQELLSAAVAQNDFGLVGEAEAYLTSACREIFLILKSGARTALDPELDERINLIVLRSADLNLEELKEVKEYLYREFLRERRRLLTQTVKQAEAAGDEAALESALKEFGNLPVI